MNEIALPRQLERWAHFSDHARSRYHDLEKTNRPTARCVLNHNLRLPGCGINSITNVLPVRSEFGYGNVIARDDAVGRTVLGSNGSLSVGLRW